MVSEATDINTDPEYDRVTDPDIAPSCIPGLDITMAPCGSTGHSVVSEATDINQDPDCSRAMDPDMALCHSPGSDVTMTPSSSTD
ncbi:hypothetical protein STEG23_023829 [Scotinomys teguina]